MWLLKHEVAEEMRRAWKRGEVPTAAQRTEHIRKHEAEAAAGPRNLQVAGDTAEIGIDGVLTEKPDFFAWLFGGGNTTYKDIQVALATAAQDPAIRKVVLKISSPGGTVAGLFDTLAVLEAFEKPITVRASLAASAAYAIAAVAGPISATNAAAEFGSIGVAVTYLHMEELIDITSTEAPNKRPDPSTEEGKAVIREHLDAIHELFVDAIARGRSKATGENLTVDTVNETFGRGAVVLAGDARKRRMIDKMPAQQRGMRAEEETDPIAVVGDLLAGTATLTNTTNAAASGGAQQPQRKKKMTKEELKAQHPELYAAILEEGEASGVTKERKRVNAHLKLADSTGAHKVARAAITSGASTMDEEVHAEYLAAGMNKRESDARQSDSDAAGAAVDGAAPKAEDKGEKKSLLDIFAADLPPAKKPAA